MIETNSNEKIKTTFNLYRHTAIALVKLRKETKNQKKKNLTPKIMKKRKYFFGYVPSTPEVCHKSNRFQHDDSTVFMFVCVCVYRMTTTNKERRKKGRAQEGKKKNEKKKNLNTF